MNEAKNRALKYARENTGRFLDELIELCAIPSISSIPAYAGEIRRAAELVAKMLGDAGLERVQSLPTDGYPVVYGEWLNAGATQPTILFYGHYDVQPALDLDAWESPPFEPQVRGENLVGRGASDMKGQTLAEINAVGSWLRSMGSLPVNVKFLVEGEEEIGSRHLRKFIQSHAELLSCDAAFNGDSGMLTADLPCITYGLRGGLRVDLIISGPKHDVHSGTFGGTLHNPAQALSELIAGLHDAQGRVTLPGFYDRVRLLEADERTGLARLPMNDAFFLEESGAPALWGEPEFTPLERTTARPTLEVLSFHAGLAGEGVLNIVPAQAQAALSMRLVPDQEPGEIYQSLMRYLESHIPPTVRWEARKLNSGGRASLLDRQSPLVQALSQALQETWGVQPAFIRIGGGIPVVAQLREELDIPSLLTGFGLPDDHIHGPNEKLHLPTWRKGIEAVIRFLEQASPRLILQLLPRSAMFDVIALDADDTLWDNEYLYSEAKKKFIHLLSECEKPEECEQRLDEIEMENVRYYGYGIKSFILSMIEAALELTERRVAAEKIAAILGFAREMLSAEVRLIDGVGETLASLAQSHPLMLITKGDPSEQQRKIDDLGLGIYFRWVEVVADKSPAVYRAILERYGIPAERFLMVGNSLRSDILPVLEIGGHAVLVPYANTWAHEMNVAEPTHAYVTLSDLHQLPGYVQGLHAKSLDG